MTKRKLRNAASYKTLRKQVKKVIKNKTLLGHGLDNDLKAMKINHSAIIDTACLFGDRKPKLSFLCQQILGYEI